METVYRVMDALLPFELFRYAFMKNALLALLLLTPLLALLGTMAVNQRMAFFSDALGHSALAGLGLGVLLGLSNVTLILVLFGILWAVLITRINRTGSASSDTTISVFSSAGIALGLLILSGSGQYNKYSSILVGDVAGHRARRYPVAGRRAGCGRAPVGGAVQPAPAHRRQSAAWRKAAASPSNGWNTPLSSW